MSGLEDALANQRIGQAPTSGVYSPDQGRDAVEAAMRLHDESMEDRLARLRHVRAQRDDLVVQLRVVTEERNRLQVQAREAVEEAAHRTAAAERDLAALHRQARAGMAVDLGGKVYVHREQLLGLEAPQVTEADLAAHGTPLLEASTGLFVPVPEGYMLSVSVTPYSESVTPLVEELATQPPT